MIFMFVGIIRRVLKGSFGDLEICLLREELNFLIFIFMAADKGGLRF